MIEFGNTLKTAREAKGLTISQVAETTRMMSTIVEELEKEDFSRIVAPIYGRGFVKLYCEAVGLDPKPMIEEFMVLYNGNREPIVPQREAPVTKTEAPLAPSNDQPLPDVADEHSPNLMLKQIVRIGIIAAIAFIILFFGIPALYRATSGNKTTTEAEEPTSEVIPAPRTPIAVEPLYMD